MNDVCRTSAAGTVWVFANATLSIREVQLFMCSLIPLHPASDVGRNSMGHFYNGRSCQRSILNLPVCLLQAEFATCAVDFLHRIGRTGRAGRAGLVTSMFTQDRSDLVEAVREAVDAQEPVVSENQSGNRHLRLAVQRPRFQQPVSNALGAKFVGLNVQPLEGTKICFVSTAASWTSYRRPEITAAA